MHYILGIELNSAAPNELRACLLSLRCCGERLLGTNRRELRKDKRGDGNFHVAHSQIVEHAGCEQIDSDAEQP
jgi:hypothetical protein